MRYELIKIFTKQANKILLLIMMLLAVVLSIFAIGSMDYVDKDGTLHSGVGAARSLTEEKNQWRGSLTPEALSKVVSEAKQTRKHNTETVQENNNAVQIQAYSDIEFMVNTILSGDTGYNQDAILQITPKQAKDLYRIREKHISEMVRQEENSPVKQGFLEKKYQEIKVPFHYEAADPWKTMFLYARTYALVLVVLVGFLAAGIFADEFRLKADTVFFSSKNGRARAARDKLWAGLLMATIVYWSGMLVLSVISFAVMGVSGAKTPIQMEDAYNIYAITYGETYLIALLCGYIASLLSASIAMLVAAKSHSVLLATFISLILFCAMAFIGIVSQFNTFFALTPDQLTNIYNCIEMSRVYEVGGMAFRQVPFVMVLYTLLSFAILPVAYRGYSRYVVK